MLAFVDFSVTCFRALSYLYPYGATLNAIKPSIAALSTGSASFPLNRPVCALYPGKVLNIYFFIYHKIALAVRILLYIYLV